MSSDVSGERRRGSPQLALTDRSTSRRVASLLLLIPGVLMLALGLTVSLHHPLSGSLAVGLFLVWTLYCSLRPGAWLLPTLALLPVLALAPWSGWFALEELDLLLAGAIAGACLGMHVSRLGTGASRAETTTDRRRVPLVSTPALVVFALLGLSALVSVVRGMQASQPGLWYWSQGYFEALNSLRMFKPIGWTLLLLPLLAFEYRHDRERTRRRFSDGMVAGLGLCSIATVWERAAFPGLLNFSTDYRASGLFWEMHVGGAALDGYLAMAMPFAIWSLVKARQPAALLLYTLVTLLGTYASLSSFSRSLYLALPFSLLVLALLARRHRDPGTDPGPGVSIWRVAVALAFIAGGSWWIFSVGGYRGLIALLSVLGCLLIAGESARSLGAPRLMIGWTLGGFSGIVLATGAIWVPKGPYLVHALSIGLFALGWAAHRAGPRRATALWLQSAVAASAVTAIGAAYHWGGAATLLPAGVIVVVLLIVALANALGSHALWQSAPRALALYIGASMILGIAVAVMSGGKFMVERFTSTQQDFDGRAKHWRDSVALLKGGGDWTLGLGPGRFPAAHYYSRASTELPSIHLWQAEGGNGFVTLSGAGYPTSPGDLLRLSHRVPAVPGIYQVSMDIRNVSAVSLHVEICEKHLLYSEACGAKRVQMPASAQSWRNTTFTIDAQAITGGRALLPRTAFLSISIETQSQKADIDNVRVESPSGTQLIRNIEFSRGTENWFFTSDRTHRPWHVENLWLTVLIDQGLIGLILFATLNLMAGGRLMLGWAGRERIAAALAASLTGFLVVGSLNSLVDVPRLAFAYYLVLAMAAVILRADPQTSRPAGASAVRRSRPVTAMNRRMRSKLSD